MPELGSLGSVRGALSNGRPYRSRTLPGYDPDVARNRDDAKPDEMIDGRESGPHPARPRSSDKPRHLSVKNRRRLMALGHF